MSSPKFLFDRERGKLGQNYVAEMLRSWGVTVYEVEDGMFPDWDIQYWDKDNLPHTIEVKHDYMASKTHNFFLELDALFHSKADLLAIVTDNPRTVYLTPLQPVLALAHSWPRKKVGGEHGESGAVVPISKFIRELNPSVLTTK